MTYVNYLTRVRITRAQKLLEETELRVYEICKLICRFCPFLFGFVSVRAENGCLIIRMQSN